MNALPVVEAMVEHAQGRVARADLLRALVRHPRWHVPRMDVEGPPAIDLAEGDDGYLWAFAFSDEAKLDAARAAGMVTVERHVVMSGSALFAALPDDTHGVLVDMGVGPSAVVPSLELPVLDELGEAIEVEAVLLGASSATDAMAVLRAYEGYRIGMVVGADGASQLMLAPDPAGRRLAAVFTAEDTLAAFAARHRGAMLPIHKVDGVTLFRQLQTVTLDGIVFNGAGPVATVAVPHAFCATVLDHQSRVTAPSSLPGGFSAHGRPHAKPASAPVASTPATSKPSPPAAPSPEDPATLDAFRARLLRPGETPPPGALVKALTPPDDPLAPIEGARVCLVANTEQGLTYATAATLGTRSFDDALREATLREHRREPVEVAKFDGRGVVGLLGTAAAEAVLAPPIIGACHGLVGAKTILVALPARGMLMACRLGATTSIERMLRMSHHVHDAAGDERLCRDPIVVREGRVVRRVTSEAAPHER